MNKIYLASPYTKLDHEDAFRKACHATALLIKMGNIVFSPIAHSHYIAKFHDLPKDVDFWREQNRAFIHWCDELWVLEIAGSKDSRGILEEIKFAKQLGKEVHYMTRRAE